MSSIAIAASLLLAANNDASGMQKADAPTAPPVVEMGPGPLIELDVFSLTGGPTASSRFSVLNLSGTTSAVLATPAVQVGWEFGSNALLVGLQLWFTQGQEGGISGSNEVAVPLTYRRYLKGLTTYGFVPFVEGSFDMDFVTVAGQVPNTNGLQFGFGIDVGFGAEYLFARSFGLMGKALLEYQHVPGTFGAGNDVNAVDFGGVLGLLVHF